MHMASLLPENNDLNSLFLSLAPLLSTHIHVHINTHMHTHTCPLSFIFLNGPALDRKQMGSWASIPVLEVEINRDIYFTNGSTRHEKIHDLERAGGWRRRGFREGKFTLSWWQLVLRSYWNIHIRAIAEQTQFTHLDCDILILVSWHLLWYLALEHIII